VHLSLYFHAQHLATGSGVVAHDSSGRQFLITAAHNFTGRHPDTTQAQSRTAGLPNRVVVEGCCANFELNLYGGDNDPNVDAALYQQHPRGAQIDVTMISVPPTARVDYPLDRSFLHAHSNTQLSLCVGQECFVVGFPEGLIHRVSEDVIFPIRITGHIASEPGVDFNGEPKLLIGAVTRGGMSGSMVIVSDRNSRRNRLVGIYTGRVPAVDARALRTGDVSTALGWVYKSSVITDLILSR
jgi:hypothetical protein